MALMCSLKIDVTKIDKTRLYAGKGGRKYLNLTIAVADEQDDYGNDVSCWEEQSKEERQNRERRNFLGSSGRVFWQSNAEGPASSVAGGGDDESIGDEDIPF